MGFTKTSFKFFLIFIIIFSSIYAFYHKGYSPVFIVVDIASSLVFSIAVSKINLEKILENFYLSTLRQLWNQLKNNFHRHKNIDIRLLNYFLGIISSLEIAFIVFMIGVTVYSGFKKLFISYHYSVIALSVLVLVFIFFSLTFFLLFYWFLTVLPKRLSNSLGSKGSVPITLSLNYLLFCLLLIMLYPDNGYYQLIFFTALVCFIILFIGNIMFLVTDIAGFLNKNRSHIIFVLDYFAFMLFFNILYATFITFTLSKSAPGAFSRTLQSVDYFYYTVITMVTVGYGDITPVTTVAKLWSIILSLSGFIYLGLLIGIFGGYIMSNKTD